MVSVPTVFANLQKSYRNDLKQKHFVQAIHEDLSPPSDKLNINIIN